MSVYTPTELTDLPIWSIYFCELADKENNPDKLPIYRAILFVESSNPDLNKGKEFVTPENYKISKVIPINTVDKTNSTLKQLISGTIYLTTEDKEISLIAKDGIIIDYSTSSDPTKPDVYEIGLDPSFIPQDSISIVAGDNIIVDYSYQNNVTTYTISAKYVSIIGKDGIKVNEIDKNVYEISLEASPIIGSDLSIIGKDGVKVTYPDSKTVEVSLDPSFIPHSDLSIIGKDGVKVNYPDSKTVEVSLDPSFIPQSGLSIIGGDGVKISEIDQNTIKISFDVSPIIASDIEVRGGVDIYVEPHTEGTTRVFTVNALSKINLDFDTNWFKINNGVVTFNEEKLIQLAEQIANNTTVNLQVTGIVDTVKNGSVQVYTTGLIDGVAETNVTIV